MWLIARWIDDFQYDTPKWSLVRQCLCRWHQDCAWAPVHRSATRLRNVLESGKRFHSHHRQSSYGIVNVRCKAFSSSFMVTTALPLGLADIASMLAVGTSFYKPKSWKQRRELPNCTEFAHSKQSSSQFVQWGLCHDSSCVPRGLWLLQQLRTTFHRKS